MSFVRKAGVDPFVWGDIVDLLRDYYSPTDNEWVWFERIFGAGFNQRLIDVDDLCANFVPPSVPPTAGDFVSGAYKDIYWRYALAAALVRYGEDP